MKVRLYKDVFVKFRESTVEDKLNEYGRRGWELVAVYGFTSGHGVWLIFVQEL